MSHAQWKLGLELVHHLMIAVDQNGLGMVITDDFDQALEILQEATNIVTLLRDYRKSEMPKRSRQ